MTNLDISNEIRKAFPATKGSIGKVSNILGVGMNDADYQVAKRVNGVQLLCPAYKCWKDMLKRSYSDKFKSKHHTYAAAHVCDEWKNFMEFRRWWVDHQVDGWCLDKDILTSGGKKYSPETCIFVPHWINCFTIGRDAARGKYAIGVSLFKRDGVFSAKHKHPFTGKSIHVGYFKTEVEANWAWADSKISLATSIKSEMDAIDERIYGCVIQIIESKRIKYAE